MSESPILRAVAGRIKEGFTYNNEYDEADVMAELEKLAVQMKREATAEQARFDAEMADD